MQGGVWEEGQRERESNLYFAMVTGTHYRTKTPPDQQPTNPSAGDMMRRVLSTGFTSMVYKVCYLV